MPSSTHIAEHKFFDGDAPAPKTAENTGTLADLEAKICHKEAQLKALVRDYAQQIMQQAAQRISTESPQTVIDDLLGNKRLLAYLRSLAPSELEAILTGLPRNLRDVFNATLSARLSNGLHSLEADLLD